MSRGINLIPTGCLDARIRSRRQLRWSLLVTFCGALLVAGWFARHNVTQRRARAEGRLAVLQAQQADLDLKLTRASRDRAELYDKARGLMSLRPVNVLPEQLLALAQKTPPGVVVSDIKAEPFILPPLPAPPPGTPAPVPAATAVDAAPAKPAIDRRPASRAIQIGGWATNFSQVQAFVDAIDQVPNWKSVRVVRTNRETRLNREWVNFRIEAVDEEAGP